MSEPLLRVENVYTAYGLDLALAGDLDCVLDEFTDADRSARLDGVEQLTRR